MFKLYAGSLGLKEFKEKAGPMSIVIDLNIVPYSTLHLILAVKKCSTTKKKVTSSLCRDQ